MAFIATSDRQLAAILFTDIVGYTAVMQRDEEKALGIVKKHNSLMESGVKAHKGKIIQFYGDGCLCTFSSATAAVKCAMFIQHLARVDIIVPLRIGLHVGEIIFEDGKVFGNGVNVASRIQSIGQENTILCSGEIIDKIRNQGEFKFVSLGSFEFKNVDHPVPVFALTNEGLNIPKRNQLDGKLTKGTRKKISRLSWIQYLLLVIVFLSIFALLYVKSSLAKSASNEPTIAVLYFDNMSGDPSQEYFSDGITEEIISRLSKLPELRVKSRISAAQYKNQPKNTRKIAKELDITNILEGSVRKQGNMVRITAQLINATTDEQIWTETYDRELKDIFEVQSEIAQQIARKFQIKISNKVRQILSSPPTKNPYAYDLYLKANSFAMLEGGLAGEQKNKRRAISLLKEVIKIDPMFADAYFLLSETYTSLSIGVENPKSFLDSALNFAIHALDFDPENEKGFIAIGNVKQHLGLHNDALKWFLKAHEVSPYSTISSIVSNYSRKNDYAKAYEWIRKGKEYDPVDSSWAESKAWLFFRVGLLDSMKNSLEEARVAKKSWISIYRPALTYFKFNGNLHQFTQICNEVFALDQQVLAYNLGVYHLFQRNWLTADSLYKMSSKSADMDVGLIQIRLGNFNDGKFLLERAIKIRLPFLGYNDAAHLYDISRCYAALKDNRYIPYLYKAFQKGWHMPYYFEHDPYFDGVRMTSDYKRLSKFILDKNATYQSDLIAAMRN